jgi:hypothetical protein
MLGSVDGRLIRGGAFAPAGRRPREDVVHEVGVVFQLIRLIFALLVHLPPEPSSSDVPSGESSPAGLGVCLIESMTLSDREGQRERAQCRRYRPWSDASVVSPPRGSGRSVGY